MPTREVSRPLFCEMVKEVQARKAQILALWDDQKSKMGVYQIRCLVDGRVYVGKAVDISVRWSKHRSKLNGNKHSSYRLQQVWNEYGCRAFVWEILEYVYNPDILHVIEDEYIIGLKAANPRFGFNVRLSSDHISEETRRKIGDGNRGKKHTEEFRQRLRDVNLGKKLTEEHKQKIGESNCGKEFTEERKRRIRESKTGKKRGPLSEEQKQKISESMIGKKKTEEHRKNMSKSQIGKKHKEETRQKLREINTGKKLSDEHKLNIGKGSLRRKMSEENKQKLLEANVGRKFTPEHRQKLREAWVRRKRKDYGEEGLES